MSTPRTIACRVHIHRQKRGRKELRPGPEPPQLVSAGRVPRVARLLALALRLDELLRDGVVANYAALARLGHVSRARVSQVMNLLCLAPDLQEQILFLPRVERGHDPITLRQLQPIASIRNWTEQRRRWGGLRDACPASPPGPGRRGGGAVRRRGPVQRV